MPVSGTALPWTGNSNPGGTITYLLIITVDMIWISTGILLISSTSTQGLP
jgi:hypothetical protein